MECSICGEEMKAEEWTWGEEEAHKECVFKEANAICSKDCGWFDILENTDGTCESCGTKLRPITEDDRKRWRKKPISN